MIKTIIALLMLGAPLQSYGWGAVGHRTTGIIATSRLTPAAQAGVRRLLGKLTLADVASWADEMRGDGSYPQTRWYHFEKLPDSVAYLDNLRDMPEWQRMKGGTVSAILAANDVLRDPKKPKQLRADALKFLVHFVGDIHQPLHTGRPDDLGAVKIYLDWYGEGMSLHKVWDSGLIMTGHKDILSKTKRVWENATAYAARLERSQAGSVINTDMDVEGWLKESLAMRGDSYDESYKTDQNKYLTRHLPEVDQRIFASGVRLAAMLNSIFDQTSAPPSQATLKESIEAIAGDLHQLITFTP